MCRAISSELAPMAIILPHAWVDLPPLHIARALLHQYSFFSSPSISIWIFVR
jgi:hypothetical protein